MAVFDVSVVMTVYNASRWLDDALQSILAQTFTGTLQVSVYNDGSTDTSMEIITAYVRRFEARGIQVVCSGHSDPTPKGPGYGRTQAVRQSSGRFICVLDADDVMYPQRIEKQFVAASCHPKTLIGSGFTRLPEDSTDRYTRWSNTLSQDQLYTQAFTAFGPTLIQPTWFCTRDVFESACDELYCKQGKGNPEDLVFFYRHLSLGGQLLRVEVPLVMYRYHKDAVTFDIDRWTIWDLRVIALQKYVLSKWEVFTIWNAGKQGRRLFRSLNPEYQSKVVAFCDVDHKKVSQKYYSYEESQERPKPKIPIVHFTDAKPPFVLCVKWDLTGGEFEKNLASLKLQEGRDYLHFS